MNTETILQLVAIVLGSNWVGSMALEFYKNKKKKKTPAEVILKSLSRVHLLNTAERYKEQGYIDAEEYDDITEEYNAYIALDGNGRVRREYGESGTLKKLPVR